MREDKVNAIRDEIRGYGNFYNSINAQLYSVMIKETMERLSCTLEEFIAGATMANLESVRRNDIPWPTRIK